MQQRGWFVVQIYPVRSTMMASIAPILFAIHFLLVPSLTGVRRILKIVCVVIQCVLLENFVARLLGSFLALLVLAYHRRGHTIPLAATSLRVKSQMEQ